MIATAQASFESFINVPAFLSCLVYLLNNILVASSASFYIVPFFTIIAYIQFSLKILLIYLHHFVYFGLS